MSNKSIKDPEDIWKSMPSSRRFPTTVQSEPKPKSPSTSDSVEVSPSLQTQFNSESSRDVGNEVSSIGETEDGTIVDDFRTKLFEAHTQGFSGDLIFKVGDEEVKVSLFNVLSI
jgi:hypothetical protein